ncbi:hypothetical protein C2W62_17110 [Candidatus Entotheonella serta]|nr:hypothetical protein C2W62_17110 [Candidatus Entotheonella serta]
MAPEFMLLRNNSIARRLGTDLSSLMLYNPQVPDANRIYAGQKLNIPATAACLAEDA